MIYLFFFLKFKAQLRRTRSESVCRLDESLVRSINDAGGKITSDKSAISAEFNEERIGFWLDMFILIENLKKEIDASKDFYGFSLVIDSKMPDSPEMLCRFLANCSGVFVNDKAARNLIPYASFEKPSEWLIEKKRRKYGSGNYYRITGLKTFKKTVKNEQDLQSDVFRILEKNGARDTLILIPEYSQIHDALYKYCEEITGDFPVLKICFGSMGLGALVDIWSPEIRSLAGEQSSSSGQTSLLGKAAALQSFASQKEEIDNLWEFLFRERIRDEVSEYIIRCTRRFIFLVFNFYLDAAQKNGCKPVIVLENIHLAGDKVPEMLLDSLAEINYEIRQELLCLGIAENDILADKLLQWKKIFPNIERMEDKKENKIYYPRLSKDLWEIIYAVSLFSRYFPPEHFQRLFEEDGINPIMIARAFSMLHSTGMIDSITEPRLANRHFEEYAVKMLADRRFIIKEMIRRRLLSWTKKMNIIPCFHLLILLAGLGSKADGQDECFSSDDVLLLKSFSYDIINETVSEIEKAIKDGQLEELCGKRSAALRFIFKTSYALYNGNKNEIKNAFDGASEEYLNTGCDSYPALKMQMLVNLGAYFLGRHEGKKAAEKAKEAILLGQNNNPFCLSKAYRVFAIVCLSKQQTTETIEYLTFALSNAEKSGNYHELAISAYYMAAIQFLHGDVYNAAKLANKSVKQSLAASCPDWADRSRFLEGRIEFDLGRYNKALEIFEELRSEPFGKKSEEKDSLLAAWIYRCKNYIQDVPVSKPEEPGYDADLFEIEAAYLSEDYQRAVELSNSLNNPFAEDDFLLTEQADWRSGFAQCEHLYFNHGEIQGRMISLFRSLALACLSQQRSEEAIHGIQQILRDEKLCEMDPWDAFYFYAKYRILEQSGAEHLDLGTAVSMAFKRLQRRAGRIEDIETRRQYMNGPRWNRELSLAAKAYKLI